MPRPELLTPDQRAELLAFPADVGELFRLATFTRSDLAFIERHRGRANRLGIAVQLVYLRHLGKTLGPREAPHAAVLRLVARQLRVAPTSWDSYAARSATRREHLLELFERLKLTSLGIREFVWVESRASVPVDGVDPPDHTPCRWRLKTA